MNAHRHCRERPCRQRRRRGGAVVEMAFCAPVFFAVVLAIIEFSRMLQIQHTVRQAAFEGARAGVTLDAVTSDVTTSATAITSSIGIVSPTITVSPNPLTYTTTTLSVTVSADPSTNGWFLKYFTAGRPIVGSITLNREVQAVSVP